MEKVKFTNVSIDNDTFNILRQLSEAVKLSKAAYLRVLIRNEAARHGASLPSVELPAPDNELVVRHGVAMTMSDLNLMERVATRLAQRLGVTIDRAKWREDFLRLMIPEQDANSIEQD